MLFPVVDKFQSGFDTKTGCSTGFSKQIPRRPAEDFDRSDLRLRPRQAEPVREEPGEGHGDAEGSEYSGVCDGFSVGDFLCAVAAD